MLVVEEYTFATGEGARHIVSRCHRSRQCHLLSKGFKPSADNQDMSKKIKIGDKVLYTIVGSIEYTWEVMSTFQVSDGTVLCLSRPEETTKLGVDRCNAQESRCLLKKT